jgi:NAD(P)-dependent dehydrogenase (short-subunit alcohol dehydrogenase family)
VHRERRHVLGPDHAADRQRVAQLPAPFLQAVAEQLRTTLPIRRVVGPADIAALAVHLMTNSAVTGATFDIDGGQQLVEG